MDRLFMTFTMDCERVASEDRHGQGTPSWEMSERAILGMAEVLEERSALCGCTYFITAETAKRHAGLSRELAGRLQARLPPNIYVIARPVHPFGQRPLVRSLSLPPPHESHIPSGFGGPEGVRGSGGSTSVPVGHTDGGWVDRGGVGPAPGAGLHGIRRGRSFPKGDLRGTHPPSSKRRGGC